MCVPRTNPATTDDPLCPKKNRPIEAGKPVTQLYVLFWAIDVMGLYFMGQLLIFVLDRNFGAPPVASGQPDPKIFAPLMVGDYITWSGVNIGGGLWSAYSIEANLGFFTAAGKAPVYLTIDVAQWGIVGSTRGEVAETRV